MDYPGVCFLGGVDSRFRGNDGGWAGKDGAVWLRDAPGFWIPAYAGMMVGGTGMMVGRGNGGAGGRTDVPGCGFPLSRE